MIAFRGVTILALCAGGIAAAGCGAAETPSMPLGFGPHKARTGMKPSFFELESPRKGAVFQQNDMISCVLEIGPDSDGLLPTVVYVHLLQRMGGRDVTLISKRPKAEGKTPSGRFKYRLDIPANGLKGVYRIVADALNTHEEGVVTSGEPETVASRSISIEVKKP